MTTWQNALTHVIISLAVIGALCALAVQNVIPGSDAFTGIIGVAIGAGVIAGANLTPTPVPPTVVSPLPTLGTPPS